VRSFSSTSSDQSINNVGNLQDFLSNRQWMLANPDAELTAIHTPEGAKFRILRDDLTHPFVGGNKQRKLDALFPQLIAQGVKDVITCGGTQSAHLLAVAAAAAENGIRAHLLIRGEPPAVSTGNHLFATMFAHSVVYIKRSDYINRSTMLSNYAESLKKGMKTSDGELKEIAIIPEGGSVAAALLGTLRLINWLDTSGTVQSGSRCILIVDSGTGTTAIGLALGVVLQGLPWHVTGVYLGNPVVQYYQQQVHELIHSFCNEEKIPNVENIIQAVEERLSWIPREKSRKFGTILPGEVEKCRNIASRYGVLVDPIWTLAAWEAAVTTAKSSEDTSDVIMVHTGGVMGSLCGVAQRWPEEFN
jgi:1-aminocyclopropane-1-carboxylate deaminase/D-cysteine desulfhydrase-like pyridoxal-dependent ACC family enzyme